MKKYLFTAIISLLVIALGTSCASSNRKCDGRKGTRTSMGLM